MKILITAFDPFGGEPINPALEAVKRMQAPAGVELIKMEVPTIFGDATEKTMAKLREIRPDAVVCIGQAAGRSDITPERVAINIMDAGIPDNAGQMPKDESIRTDGPAAYFTTLPIKKMVAAIKDARIPSSVSNSAGDFVCNSLMYGVLDGVAREFPRIKAGFIHVPCVPEQAERMKAPSLPLETIVKALEIAVSVIE